MVDTHDSAIDASHALPQQAPNLAVLHVVDPASSGGGPCGLRLTAQTVQRLDSVRHDVVVIGTTADVAMAARCGLEPVGSLCPSRSIALSGWRDLRRLIHQLSDAHGPYDLVHAWTARSALLASMAVPHMPRIATLHIGPVDGFSNWLLARQVNRHPMRLLAASPAIEQDHRAIGFDRRQFSLMPPAIDPNDRGMIGRDDVRARWREEAGVDVSTFVVGLLCEPATWPDAMTAATVVARVALSGRNVRVVMHHDVAARRQAVRFLRDLSFDNKLILDDAIAEPWRVVNGLDAALMMGGRNPADCVSRNGSTHSTPWSSMLVGGAWKSQPAASVLPLLWAFAAGVPVIAAADDAAGGMIEDGVNGLLVDRHDPNAASDRIARMIDDREPRRRLALAGQSLVHDAFHIDAYCLRLKHAYELLLTERSMRSKDNSGRGVPHGAPMSGSATATLY